MSVWRPNGFLFVLIFHTVSENSDFFCIFAFLSLSYVRADELYTMTVFADKR